MFDLDRFIADCRDAVTADATHKLVREVVARTACDPTAILAGLNVRLFAEANARPT
jgi:hypothetical protein